MSTKSPRCLSAARECDDIRVGHPQSLGFQSCETGSHFLVQIHNFVKCIQLLWLHWTYLCDPLIVVYFQQDSMLSYFNFVI